MSSQNSVHISAIHTFLSGSAAKNLDYSEIMEKLGEPRTLLDNPDARFATRKMGQLIAVVSNALQDETLGYLERATDLGARKLLVQACVTCSTLRESLIRYISFWALVHKDFSFTLSEEGEEARLSMNFDNPKVANSNFSTVIFLHTLRLSSWLIDKPIILDRLNVCIQKPEYAEDYSDLFPCKHYFGHSENSLIFDKKFLNMTIIRRLDEVDHFMKNSINLMTYKGIDKSLTNKIKRMLINTDNVIALPLKSIAEELDKSPDTIRRYLKKEGNTFAEIKLSVRKNLATSHLNNGIYPIHQIAKMVGFSDPSAFNRAFKSWTGKTPSEYRYAAK